MADGHSTARTIPAEKLCTTCGSTLPIDQFWKNTDSHDGHAWICKPCGSIANKAYKSTHKMHGPHRKRVGWKLSHGQTGSSLHRRWKNMKNRCNNPKCVHYDRYGGRGIFVCDEWARSSSAFINWAMTHGYQPGLQIDRINNDGPYSPENCRWVTCQQNVRNSTTPKLTDEQVAEIRRLVASGQYVTGRKGSRKSPVSAADLARRFGVQAAVIWRCATGQTYPPFSTDEVSR